MNSKINSNSVFQDEVSRANQRFYDQIAKKYDEVDRRRGDHIDHTWVDEVFTNIVFILKPSMLRANKPSFMDAASGSGFLAQLAQKFFHKMTLLDISRNMLRRTEVPGTLKVCSDACFILVNESSFDFIGGFATLHHLKSPKIFFQESYIALR